MMPGEEERVPIWLPLLVGLFSVMSAWCFLKALELALMTWRSL